MKKFHLIGTRTRDLPAVPPENIGDIHQFREQYFVGFPTSLVLIIPVVLSR
jgi:hypothetical protein